MSLTNNPRKITRAILPAAGKGTRLLPLTKAVPKELIPLGTRPVMEHVVDEVVQAGITEILFIISEEKIAIRSHFRDGLDGVRFHYAFQPEQKGLADALIYGRDFAGDKPFAVVLADSIIYTDQPVTPFQRVLDTFRDTNASGVVVVQRTPRDEVSRYGIVKPKDGADLFWHDLKSRQDKIGRGFSFEIDGLVEKPAVAEAPSEFAIAGRYAFDSSIFGCIERTQPGANGEYQLTDSIGIMLEDELPVWCVALGANEVRRDIGTFPSYFEALQIELDKERRW